MAETGDRKEVASQDTPAHIGAVFENGGNRVLVHDRFTGKDLVPVYRIDEHDDPNETKGTHKGDRKRWTFDNLRVFSDGKVPVPEQQWLQIIHSWKKDLDTAKDVTAREIKDPRERRAFESEITQTDKWLKAAMSVSAAARAMEGSQGVANACIGSLTGNPEVTSSSFSSEFFLAGDAQKYLDVLNDPLVNHYFTKILEDAKINLSPRDEWHEETTEEVDDKTGEVTYKKEWKPSKVDKNNIRVNDFDFKAKESKSKLVDYLRFKNKYDPDFKYKGGLNAYIAEVLLTDPVADGKEAEALTASVATGAENADSIRWTAAKLACDLFLVDKFTRWEYVITNADDPKNSIELKLTPVPRWQGDPLRAILQPSFVPRVLKSVYAEDVDKNKMGILDLVDNAFRPKDIFSGKREEKALPASMVGSLSNYAKYNDALSKFLGGPLGNGIGTWSPDSMKELYLITDSLVQVYGPIKGEKGTQEPRSLGKHIVGAMVSRIVECKALGLSAKSKEQNTTDKLRYIIGNDEEDSRKQLMAIEKFLFGTNRDFRTGFFAELSSEQHRVAFNGNIFDAEESISETIDILTTNSQTPEKRKQARNLIIARALANIVKAGAKASGVR